MSKLQQDKKASYLPGLFSPNAVFGYTFAGTWKDYSGPLLLVPCDVAPRQRGVLESDEALPKLAPEVVGGGRQEGQVALPETGGLSRHLRLASAISDLSVGARNQTDSYVGFRSFVGAEQTRRGEKIDR